MICFLDRDGIFNVDYGYVGTFDRFTWNADVFVLLSALKAYGYSFVLVTNQSGIGRGYYRIQDFYDLSFYMLNYLYDFHSIEMEINFCPHRPSDNCKCRKPSPGMLLRYSIESSDIMIGDNATDMESARLAGISRRWLISSRPSGVFTSHFKDLKSLLISLPTLLQT
jgi:D-glycero-D-manno-heptose 1,7-bisphosphate phosphatase